MPAIWPEAAPGGLNLFFKYFQTLFPLFAAVSSLSALPGQRSPAEAQQGPPNRPLWPLPSGKSPFMKKHATHEGHSNDEPWRGSDKWRGVPPDWKNPVFSIQTEPPNVNQLTKYYCLV